MTATASATGLEEIDRFEGGVGWLAYPGESMQRASHALAADGELWVVDPVDAEGVDDLLAGFGEVAGVVVLLDRHRRDAAALARRHDVSVWIPESMDGVADELDAPVERFRHELAETGYAAHALVDNRLWQETVLYSEETGVLVVPEAVGTAEYFRAGDETLGVHPVLRVTPPRLLKRFEPERVLVGHGRGVHEDAAAELAAAVDGSRRRTPTLYFENLKRVVFG